MQYPVIAVPVDAGQLNLAAVLPLVGATAVSGDGPVDDEAEAAGAL